MRHFCWTTNQEIVETPTFGGKLTNMRQLIGHHSKPLFTGFWETVEMTIMLL